MSGRREIDWSVPSLRRLRLLVALILLAACGDRAVVKPGGPPPGAAARTPSSAPAEKPAPQLVAIELYGTSQITFEQLLTRYGDELHSLGEALMRGDQVDVNPLLEKLYALGDFARIIPSIVGYYERGGMKYYLTIDFVDRRDATHRMPFRPTPTGSYPDPEGLITEWRDYEAKVFALQVSGKMSMQRIDCPAFHCLGDPAHPDVKSLAAKFAARVPDHIEELSSILLDDRDARHRAAAAFLLAYSPDGPAMVRLMVRAFRDGSTLVRSNAIRVVADVALHHHELDIPIDPVLEALDYPSTLDRNKAAAVLTGILEQPGKERLHQIVATRAGAILIAMLRLQQPNNHDFAYRILKMISGRDLGERDYTAWEAWLRSRVSP